MIRAVAAASRSSGTAANRSSTVSSSTPQTISGARSSRGRIRSNAAAGPYPAAEDAATFQATDAT